MADDAAAPEAVDAEPQAPAKTGKPTMSVKVYAPFKVYYEGDAYSISAVNATGPFDILPHHHNFLCMLVPCTIMIKDAAGDHPVKAHRALMHVKADHVSVFMDV